MTRPDPTRGSDATEYFWDLTEPLLAEPGVEEGTLMQFPCLRAEGEFFAMPQHTTGELVVKLPAARVAELITDGVGQPFGPGEKVFKEWMLVGHDHRPRWPDLLDEACAFARRR